MEPEDILFADGSDNTPGLAVQEVMYASVDDIDTMICKCDGTTPGNFTALGTMATDIIMKPDKCFHRIYFTDETGEMFDELVGEVDGKAIKNSLKFFHPGEHAEVLGFTSWAKNKKGFVFIVKDKDCHVRAFGSICTPAKLVAAPGGTKAKNGDRKGREFTFEYTGADSAPYFTGRVNLTGAAGYATGQPGDFQTLFVN